MGEDQCLSDEQQHTVMLQWEEFKETANDQSHRRRQQSDLFSVGFFSLGGPGDDDHRWLYAWYEFAGQCDVVPSGILIDLLRDVHLQCFDTCPRFQKCTGETLSNDTICDVYRIVQINVVDLWSN